MMKKFLAIIVSIIMAFAALFVLVGCVDGNPDTNKPPVDDTNLMVLTEKQKVLNGAYGAEAQTGGSQNTYYGVGRTLNVITDDYITVSSGYGKVFDADKLLNINWRKTFTGKMNSTMSTGESMKTFYNDFTEKVGVSLSAGVDVGFFSAKLNSAFEFAKGDSFKETENELFYTASQIYAANLIEIDGYYDLSQFENLLSDKFLQDIQALENGKKTPEQIVNIYGTHAILAGYYGGRLDCNYYLQNTGTKWESRLATSIKNNVSATFGGVAGGSVGIESSIAVESGVEESEIFESFSAESIGGANFSALSLSDFRAKYSTWVDSMNDQTEYSNIVGFPTRSLAAIWDILPSKYSSAKKTLKSYFESEAKSVSDNFLKDYARSIIVKPDTCSVCGIDLSVGGCGAENHPYLITNALQLVNIEKDMDAHYRLVNDIDISSVTNWEPIGGAYLAKAFNGVLDGDGHKIIGLSRQSAIAENQSRSFFGLFGCVGEKGVVKNIVFDKVNIRITGPANNNSSMRAFYGVIAGKCMGKVSNVELNGSFVYACCTDGCSYLGGICGYAVNAEIYYCKNNIDLAGDRYAAQVGGIVSVSEGGIIAYCENTGDITAICTTGGAAFAGGICAVGHSVNTPRLISNSNFGKLKVGHYPATVGGNLRTGETDFAWKEDVKY